MKKESLLAVSVGLPAEMMEVEEELQQKGFVQVSASPSQLTPKQYTRRENAKILDRMQGKTSSVIIAWRS